MAWSVCVFMCFGDTDVLCKNGWTDGHAVLGSRCRLGADSCGSKEPCFRPGSRSDKCIRSRYGYWVTSRRCGLLPNYIGHLCLISHSVILQLRSVSCPVNGCVMLCCMLFVERADVGNHDQGREEISALSIAIVDNSDYHACEASHCKKAVGRST